jgi:hypothetical protein
MDVWRPGSSAPDDVIKAIYSALDSATEPWPTGLSPTHNGPVTFSAPVTADTDIIGLSDNDEDDDDDKDDQDDEDDKDDAAEAATVEAPGPPLVSRLSLASDAVWLQLHDGCQPLQVAAAAREVVERVLLRDGGAEVQEIQVWTGCLRSLNPDPSPVPLSLEPGGRAPWHLCGMRVREGPLVSGARQGHLCHPAQASPR